MKMHNRTVVLTTKSHSCTLVLTIAQLHIYSFKLEMHNIAH